MSKCARARLSRSKQKLKYGTYGPLIFTRKDGKIADFGKLSFSSGYRTTYFLRCSDTTSAEPLAHFLEKYWRLRRPDVLISVTGSAASIQITAQLQRVQNLFHSVQLNVNNPHFLIMQGRITKVLNMKPIEILGMIEEAAGTRMFESKKQAAPIPKTKS